MGDFEVDSVLNLTPPSSSDSELSDVNLIGCLVDGCCSCLLPLEMNVSSIES